MSYILDALKKSQNSRGQPESRQNQPNSPHFLEEKKVSRGLALEPQPKPTILSRWFWVIVLALTVNGTITLYHHLSDPQHGVNGENPKAVLAPELQTDHLADNKPHSSSYVSEIANTPESRGINRQDNKAILNSKQTAGDTGIPSDPARKSTSIQSIDIGTPPFLWQKSAGFQQKIPDMNIDMLFYTDKPPQRFVFINMKKLREGERVTKEVYLNEIRSNALVLSYRGELFRVNAQR